MNEFINEKAFPAREAPTFAPNVHRPGSTTRFAGWNGVHITADVFGDPDCTPILLLHGAGQTRHSWRKASAELVARGFRVIAMDLRGHGDSDWATDGEYSADAYINDLRAVVAALDKRPIVVGASLGGSTALLALGEEPSLPALALVLVDVVARMDQVGVRRIRDFMAGNMNGFGSIEEAADAVSRYLPHRPRPKSLDGLRRNLRMKADGRYYWHWDPRFHDTRHAMAGMTERRERAARNVQVPTLLIRGGNSEVVSVEAADELMRLLPHAKFADVAGAAHMVAGDDNDAFVASLISFIQESRLGASKQ